MRGSASERNEDAVGRLTLEVGSQGGPVNQFNQDTCNTNRFQIMRPVPTTNMTDTTTDVFSRILQLAYQKAYPVTEAPGQNLPMSTSFQKIGMEEVATMISSRQQSNALKHSPPLTLIQDFDACLLPSSTQRILGFQSRLMFSILLSLKTKLET